VLVPAITIDALEVEGMVILPPEICGLVVGDLNIPALSLLLLEIPEIVIPDFQECPFYVDMPPPIKYASSVYPIYEIDALTPSMEILAAQLLHLEDIAALKVSASILSGEITQYRQVDLDNVEPDNLTVNLVILSGESTSFGYLTINDIPPDNLTTAMTLLSGEIVNYGYITNTIEVHSLSVSMLVLSGELD
jgi:hypothetical protein